MLCTFGLEWQEFIYISRFAGRNATTAILFPLRQPATEKNLPMLLSQK